MPAILGLGFGGLLIVSVPIGIAIGLASLAALYFGSDVPLEIAAQRLVSGVRSFPMLAIPLFVFAGSIMNAGGITNRLITFAYALVGRTRGALGGVNIVTNMVFGGISGSAVADASAVGKILIPQMQRRGYTSGYAASLTAVAATLAVVIPPSINLIVYGVSAEASIGDLFYHGLYIGLAMGLIYILASYIIARIKNFPVEQRMSRERIFKGFRDAALSLLFPIIVLGGIRVGAFTPTEGGAVAVFIAFILGGLVYRELSIEKLKKVFTETVILVAALMLIIASAQIYSWALVEDGIPMRITNAVLSVSENPFVILLLVNIILIVVGMVLEGNAAIIIFTPILLPIVAAAGVHPVHFGLILVMNLAIGLYTPPVGLTLLITTKIAGIRLEQSFRSLIPWLVISVTVLMSVSYIPLIFNLY